MIDLRKTTEPQELFTQLATAKKNVIWLLEHQSGLVDMHGLAYWAQVVENLRTKIKNSL